MDNLVLLLIIAVLLGIDDVSGLMVMTRTHMVDYWTPAYTGMMGQFLLKVIARTG